MVATKRSRLRVKEIVVWFVGATILFLCVCDDLEDGAGGTASKTTSGLLSVLQILVRLTMTP